MEGKEVVTSDDQQLGKVVAEHDDCVVVELGHVFKSKHAIPTSFLHEHDGKLRATVTKEIVADSPKIDLDDWDHDEIYRHYGLETEQVVDPDPEGLESPDTVGARSGVEPAPSERAGILGGENDPDAERAASFERPGSSAGAAGVPGHVRSKQPRPPEERTER